jgi:membrane-bound metal-dependent hydrolase YbcI (DUF457 family)
MSWAAHELESVVLHKHLKATWRVSYMAILVGALMPDFTKLPVYGLHIGGLDLLQSADPWQYHRGWPGVGFTHSLMFGIVVGALVYALTRSGPWAIGLALGQWSHVLTDTADSVGCMVFFPFTTQHYSFGMWQYGPQMGRYGDTAAYYSSLGGVWDTFWLLILVLFAREALGRRYFHDVVEPADPLWGRLRRLGLGDLVLRTIFRAYVVYGACRIAGWFLWARLVNPDRGVQVLDWSWGGPSWVEPAPPTAGASTPLGVLGVTLIGVIGVAATIGVVLFLLRALDRVRHRVPLPAAVGPADLGSAGSHTGAV